MTFSTVVMRICFGVCTGAGVFVLAKAFFPWQPQPSREQPLRSDPEYLKAVCIEAAHEDHSDCTERAQNWHTDCFNKLETRLADCQMTLAEKACLRTSVQDDARCLKDEQSSPQECRVRSHRDRDLCDRLGSRRVARP